MNEPSDNNIPNSKQSAKSSTGNPVKPIQFEAIKPSEVPLTSPLRSSGEDDNSGDGTLSTPWQKNRALIVGLPIALIALLGVVFVLPSFIKAPSAEKPLQVEVTTPAETSTVGNLETTATGPVESPWTDAQFAKQRRETQDILSELLDRQETLEKLEVKRWGAEAFATAAEQAQRADALYRQQQYEEARTLYEETLAQLEQLIKHSEVIFQSSLEQGLAALNAGDQAAATQHFQLATMIHPESTAAQTGIQRASTLEQVMAVVREGKRHQRQGDLEQAKASFSQALALDKDWQEAQSSLTEINQQIKDSDYAKSMSQGFAALNQGNNQQAIAHFQQALTIKPNADDAKVAIKQAQNQSAQNTLQQLLQQAANAEAGEEWQVAVDSYDKALEIDGNLVQAKVGKIKAEHRANIDSRMVDILNNPERLASAEVFSEYQKLGREVRDNIKDRGPRLQQQFEQLEKAMRRAIAPVDVVIQSDNQTEVTIYQIGALGKFQQQTLTMKPGTYVAVGTRPGYRDVRREITITASRANQPIVVQCEEPINSSVNNG